MSDANDTRRMGGGTDLTRRRNSIPDDRRRVNPAVHASVLGAYRMSIISSAHETTQVLNIATATTKELTNIIVNTNESASDPNSVPNANANGKVVLNNQAAGALINSTAAARRICPGEAT